MGTKQHPRWISYREDSPRRAHSPPRPASRAARARRGFQPVLEGPGARGSLAPRGRPHPRWGRGSRVLRALLAAGQGGRRAGVRGRRRKREGAGEEGAGGGGGRWQRRKAAPQGQDSPVPWAPARQTRPAGTRKPCHQVGGPGVTPCSAGRPHAARSPSRLSLPGGRPRPGRPANGGPGV